jgi:hypothetical protein
MQILVRPIEEKLIVGVAVDGRHEAFGDPKRVMQDLHHRDDTVGRA